MTLEIDQALFGYNRGHRLIATSRKLGKDATWILRNVTDMKVPRPSSHYLTVLPVGELHAQAFVRTWAAEGDFRPGSVWSHVLIVTHSDLDVIEDLCILLDLFRRPTIDNANDIDLLDPVYRTRVSVPNAAEKASAQPPVNPSAVDRIVLAAYSPPESDRAEVSVEDARPFERIVIGLMNQRSSTLRRDFSARTRYRPSQTSAAKFGLEIVERGSGTSEKSLGAVPGWATALSADLRVPDAELRRFLRSHALGDDKPADIAALADVYASARQSTEAVVGTVAKRFPRPLDRQALKRDLFGADPLEHPISDIWPDTDPDRLKLLLTVPPTAVSLADYDTSGRLAKWAAQAPVDAAVAVRGAVIAKRREDDIAELARGVATGFDAEWTAKLVATLPRLAPMVLVARPDAWSRPEIWTGHVDHELLLNVISQGTRDQRGATLIDLLFHGLESSAAELLSREPSLWWAIADPKHATRVAEEARVIAASRRLGLTVTADRGSCPWQLNNLSQATVIASASDPDEGLWREVHPQLWVETYKAGIEPVGDNEYGPARHDVMALAAGMASTDPGERRLLWHLTFARLHAALLGTGTPPRCEITLTALLPDGPSWDWCGRLRYALAKTAVSDNWSQAELRDMALGAGAFADDVIQIADAIRKRSNRSLLEEVVDFFTWWK